MKKILCLIDTVGFRGGAERQMIGLVQMLIHRGYTTDLVIYHDNPSIPEIRERYGICPHILKTANTPWGKLLAVKKYIRDNGKFDAVITYKDGANLIGCMLKLLGLKINLIISERNTTQKIDRFTRFKFWLYRFADYIVPNSYSQTIFLERNFPYLTSKLRTINNFTDTELFNQNIITPKAIRSVLTVARIAEQKNVLNYLEALSILRKRGVKNVSFEWYGDVQRGEEEYMEAVKKAIDNLSLADYVTFHKADINIVPIYQKCDVFCLPSNFEGYPNVVCEAMSCGKPIVCSRVCDNPMIVSEKQNGIFFDPKSPENMADQLEQIIRMSDSELMQWGKESRNIAEKKFSRDAFVDKYIKLIEYEI